MSSGETPEVSPDDCAPTSLSGTRAVPTSDSSLLIRALAKKGSGHPKRMMLANLTSTMLSCGMWRGEE